MGKMYGKDPSGASAAKTGVGIDWCNFCTASWVMKFFTVKHDNF